MSNHLIFANIVTNVELNFVANDNNYTKDFILYGFDIQV